jgi:hypothetical protein
MSVYSEDSCASSPIDCDVQMTKGVKGSDVYTDAGVGNALVALATKLVRGADSQTLATQFTPLLKGSNQQLTDAIVLAFQTRDVRGGKGERKLFQDLMTSVHASKPDLASALINLIPEYGSWDDVFTLGAAALKGEKWDLLKTILETAHTQIVVDETTVLKYETDVADAKEKGSDPPVKPSISLVAKWAPREKKQFDKLAISMANNLAGRRTMRSNLQHSQIMSAYRKRISALNKYLDTVEVKECAKSWGEIVPSHVPARAREIKKAAYLNEKLRKGDAKRSRAYFNSSPPELRHPDDADRMACREHFQSFFSKAAKGEVKISGAETLYPHEIVTKAEGLRHHATQEDKDSLNAVWMQMVAKAAAGGGLGKSLFMCDFSGSMQGTPMQVAKAMGLLGSAVCSGPLKGRFLTFNTTPEWCEIDTTKTLFEQLEQLNHNWGGSTDIQKAGEMIIAELKKSRAAPGSAPENLIIVTDMGFDAACGSSEYSAYTGATYRHNVKTAPKQTHAQMLRENFRRASEDVHGDPNAWAAPRIVVWNVAATYSDNHQATASEEGVVTLSGWSPSLFKILCEEGPRVVTAWDALRAQLDDKRYDPVRQRVAEWLAGGWRTVI